MDRLRQPAVVIDLGPDEPVALARPLVRWVVTEYGTAYLFGKSIAERALALIAIAHPDDRAVLLAGAHERGIVRAGQRLRSRTAYPVEEERELALTDGRSVLLRPTRAIDLRALPSAPEAGTRTAAMDINNGTAYRVKFIYDPKGFDIHGTPDDKTDDVGVANVKIDVDGMGTADVSMSQWMKPANGQSGRRGTLMFARSKVTQRSSRCQMSANAP